MKAWNLLADGNGGVDWGPGFDRVADYLGITDHDMLIHQLGVIKLHRSAADQEGSPA